jgi:HD-GYP domain-containing protein (c-di-GMP phosphodiesterase class II)
VRLLDGYGPVADIILSHHERWDGAGYPRGLAGEQIPLAARLISVADTYDVLTARDSYREPVSSDDAIAELRRVAGHQLDAAAVEAFVRLLASKDIAFRHADDAEFEAELAFERRVREYARPRRSASV